jgi:hypothetical protein
MHGYQSAPSGLRPLCTVGRVHASGLIAPKQTLAGAPMPPARCLILCPRPDRQSGPSTVRGQLFAQEAFPLNPAQLCFLGHRCQGHLSSPALVCKSPLTPTGADPIPAHSLRLPPQSGRHHYAPTHEQPRNRLSQVCPKSIPFGH